MQTHESPPVDELDQLTLDLVNRLSLTDVYFLKTSAERADSSQDVTDETAYSADFSLSVDFKDDGSALRVCAKVGIELEIGNVETEVAVVYSCDDENLGEIPSAVVENFVNRVAFMAAFPYLRAEVSSLTGKVFGNPLHMPVLTQDDVKSSQVK